jgi:homoserine O-succinyltransferase/O-acetyltransferase
MTLLRTLARRWKARDMLAIGVVNNMPTAAIQSTERHFRDVLNLAAGAIEIDIRWFRLAGARPANYRRLEELWECELDGLIVTGSEPRAALLPDEPFWQPLTKTIEWAAHHTSSVIWSCLAAHAAVLYLDGVERRRHEEKIFGIFESVRMADHPILANTQPIWRVPHSRWNDLAESDLSAKGYTVLAKSQEAGIDLFVKQVQRSLFLFIQTHPEYDVGTLMREYRRDITRYHGGEQDTYPKVPRNYFNNRTAAELELLSDIDADERRARGLAVLEQAELPDGWQSTAVQLYGNWLSHLAMASRQNAAEAAL